ncbi:hypothetical protein R3P38DRAFT_3258309 [Favolaschia claudopus]|uniref:Post-SET domain-containing protein n=1 Tax=Favolaschia claudopus TaxID=2862362 RepID=A0AAW0D3K6_9AGAR
MECGCGSGWCRDLLQGGDASGDGEPDYMAPLLQGTSWVVGFVCQTHSSFPFVAQAAAEDETAAQPLQIDVAGEWVVTGAEPTLWSGKGENLMSVPPTVDPDARDCPGKLYIFGLGGGLCVVLFPGYSGWKPSEICLAPRASNWFLYNTWGRRRSYDCRRRHFAST